MLCKKIAENVAVGWNREEESKRRLLQFPRLKWKFNFNTFWRSMPVIYGVSPKSRYKRSDGDCTCKNGSKKKSNILSFETSFSRKTNSKIRQVAVCCCKFPSIRLCSLYVLYEIETYQMSSNLKERWIVIKPEKNNSQFRFLILLYI